MKFAVKFFCTFVLVLLSCAAVAQSRTDHAGYAAQKSQQPRLRINAQAVKDYILQQHDAQLRQRAAWHQARNHEMWPRILGEAGLRLFAPERVEEILRQAGFDLHIPDYPSEALAIEPHKTFYYPDGIYLVQDTTGIYDEVNGRRKITLFSDASDRRHVPFVSLYREPVLLVQGQKNKQPLCAILAAGPQILGLTERCEEVKSYAQHSARRIDVIKDAGFSDGAAARYGGENPWNLRVFTGCKSFDGQAGIEKAVLAWRYATIATDKAVSNHQKDFRYLYIGADGKEHETAPRSADKLPHCAVALLPLEEKGQIYFSNTQPAPYERGVNDHVPSASEPVAPLYIGLSTARAYPADTFRPTDRYRDFTFADAWNF